MEYKTKKRLTIIGTGLFFFLGGVEYAIIMPTLYLYIQDLGGSPSYFGIVLSAFSFSGLLVAPIFGILQDKLHKTKILIIIANLFEIVGNLMYFMGFNLWFLLLSRLVAGVGFGVQSTIFAQISRTTYEEDRASAISLALGLKQVGLLLGPGFNLFLVNINFWIGPFEVNKYTIPGLLMFVLWILAELYFIFFYFDLPTLPELQQQQKQQQQRILQQASTESRNHGNGKHTLSSGVPKHITSINNYHEHQPSNEYNASQNLDASGNGTSKSLTNIAETEDLNAEQSSSWKDEFLREEIVVLLWAQFVFSFEMKCMEAVLTPMAQLLMDFGEVENSVTFCLMGAEVILCFILVKIVSKRVTDRWLIAIGFVLEIGPLVLMLFVYPQAPYHDRSANMAWFVVAFILQVAGLAFCGVAIVSLFSKLVSESNQGFSQGIRRSVGGIATILGPLWAGGAVTMGYVLIGVVLFLYIMSTIMMAISWKFLKAPGDDDLGKSRNKNTDLSSTSHDEKSPLLVNDEDVDIKPTM